MLEKKNENLIFSGSLGQTMLDLNKYDPHGFYAISCSKQQESHPKWKKIQITKGLSPTVETQLETQKFLSNVTPNKTSNKEKQTKVSKQANITSIFSKKAEGVSRGFFIYLKIVGIGYRVFLNEDLLTLKLGFSHLYKTKVPNSVKIFLPEPTLLCLYGIEKNQVSQVAAQIIQIKRPSPYKGKGIRVLDSKITLKTGKKKS